MRKIKLFFIVSVLLSGMFCNSCKKSDSTSDPVVTPPGVGEYVGTLAVYSKSDTLLAYFLKNNLNRITGALELYSSDDIDYNKFLVNNCHTTFCF